MAKVLLHSVSLDTRAGLVSEAGDPNQGKWFQGAHKLFTESAGLDPFRVHTLTNDPKDADVIVFVEVGAAEGLFVEWVRHHPYVRQYREKCFLFTTGDFTQPFLPGLYASLERHRYQAARTRTGYYLRLDENPFIDERPVPEHPAYLACFVGTIKHHPVRVALKQLPDDKFLIEDTSEFAQKMLFLSPEEKAKSFWPHYADTLASSAFALAPRGKGCGSIRLFEAMQMGRCPVILADDWKFPHRVDWNSCSIVVSEKDVARLPEILERNLPRAAELGKQARLQWETYYAPPVRFHWLVEDCLEMLGHRRVREAIAGRLIWFRLLHRKTLIDYLRSKRQIYKRERKIVL